MSNDLKKVGNYFISSSKTLGKGAFGTVFYGYKEDDPSIKVAAKVISRDLFKNHPDKEKFIQLIRREIQVLQSISNPNIVRLYDAFETVNNIYLFFEYCKDGDLQVYRASRGGQSSFLSEAEAITFFQHICNGFKSLNELKIIHRDIKPPNILLHNGHAKIADFGFARFTDDINEKAYMTEGIGTPLYMAPEIYSKSQYSSKCDVWSLGMLFYELLYGKTPWIGRSSFDLFENNIKVKPLIFPAVPKRSDKVKNILKKMLIVNQEFRIDWDGIFIDEIMQDGNINIKNIENNVGLNESLKQSMIKNARQITNKLVQGNLIAVDERGNKIRGEINSMEDKKVSIVDEKRKTILEIGKVDVLEKNDESLLVNNAKNIIFYERNIAFFLKLTCHLLVTNYTNTKITLDDSVLYQIIFILQKYEMIIMKYVLMISFAKIKIKEINQKMFEIPEYITIIQQIKIDYDDCNKVFLQVFELIEDRKRTWIKNNTYLNYITVINNELICDKMFCETYKESLNNFFKVIAVQFFNYVDNEDPENIDIDYLKLMRFMQICKTIESPYNYFLKAGDDTSQVFYHFYECMNSMEKKSLISDIKKNWNL